ncbi:hypothetical protein B0H16DRAFT_1480756 [Mycena metata]|uniref:Uncharacterized protein n=1 Tax=Mycena metata TaxID=1033252 RepID=A0AAD7H275_9AGAR|nr:hypothetical protein B0H16DRAFT_1480756 [Mycena metata]
MAHDEPIDISDNGQSDTDIDGQLQQIMSQAHLQKWSVMSPSLMKKKEQEAARKAKHKEKKWKRDDSDEPKPRSKKSRVNADNEDDDSELPPVHLSVPNNQGNYLGVIGGNWGLSKDFEEGGWVHGVLRGHYRTWAMR